VAKLKLFKVWLSWLIKEIDSQIVITRETVVKIIATEPISFDFFPGCFKYFHA